MRPQLYTELQPAKEPSDLALFLMALGCVLVIFFGVPVFRWVFCS